MGFIRGRYSWLLRPSLIVYDLLVINVLSAVFFSHITKYNLLNFEEQINNHQTIFYVYLTIFWLFSARALKFYEVYRYTSIIQLFSLLLKQFLVFSLGVFAFAGIFRGLYYSPNQISKFLLFGFFCVALVKVLSYVSLKLYRIYLRGNLRNVVLIGDNNNSKRLREIFLNEKDLGYKLIAVFGNSGKLGVHGTIEESFDYLTDNSIVDEIYCSIDELTEKDINAYVRIANLNHCNIKFIPNTKKLVSKKLQTEYYQYTPILSIQEARLNNEENQLLKRSFDIVFSVVVIILVLSWLSLILFVLIKLESKGPLFYKHKRTGINYKVFNCYKYRSMYITQEIKGTYVGTNDSRVTRIGRFLRRTSLDELPQFFNVLFGDMSVVGPRPHMLSYTELYAKKINKYNFIYRHQVKPGITGLAQTRGYRGEIKNDQDIIGRVKYDVFYIENWSFLLDLKIILKTLINMFKGEDKAY